MLQNAQVLIVGLGNPGSKYAHNRHNIGFMVLDELARRAAVAFAPGTPGSLSVDLPGCTLLKPQTYMNLSGEALVQWAARTGAQLSGAPAPAADDSGDTGGAAVASVAVAATSEDAAAEGFPVRLLVVCDDLALPLGSVRLRPRGSSGGQNGLASIIEHLGGDEFPRLRLGIAPVEAPVPPEQWPAYVLADFAPGEAEAVADLVRHAADAVECWREHGLEAAVSRFNRRIRPDG